MGRKLQRKGWTSAGLGGLAVGLGMAAGLSLALPATAASASSHQAKTLNIVTEKVPSVGTVLATSSGLTLYHFAADPTGQATCTGGCAKVWPPLLLAKGEHVHGPRGLKNFGTIRLAGGKRQVSFHGRALYRFAGDKKKGHAAGQGVEGTWFAVLDSNTIAATTNLPAGQPSSTSTSTSTSTSNSTSSGATTTTTGKSVTPTTTAKTTSPPTTRPPTTPPPPPTTQPPPPTTTTTPPPPTTTTAPSGGYGY